MPRLFLLLALSSCVVVGPDPFPEAPQDSVRPPASREAPKILDAEAVVRWNGQTYWSLDAEVEARGAPIEAVVFDFYDLAHERCLVESIELFPGYAEGAFEHDWYGSHDVLDPFHPDYVVEVTVIDTNGQLDWMEIWPRL